MRETHICGAAEPCDDAAAVLCHVLLDALLFEQHWLPRARSTLLEKRVAIVHRNVQVVVRIVLCTAAHGDGDASLEAALGIEEGNCRRTRPRAPPQTNRSTREAWRVGPRRDEERAKHRETFRVKGLELYRSLCLNRFY